MKDHLDRAINLTHPPKRIISLVPSQSELVVDLGLEKELVGITKFCIHPKHLKSEKVIVGGTKQVDYDKIRNLKPDIILCNKEENTQEMIVELEKIAPVHISDIYTIADTLKLISDYGDLFNCSIKADKIIENIQNKKDGFLNSFKPKSYKSVAYFIWKKPWMVAGSHNFIHHLLELNGLKNYYGNVERYPEVMLDEKCPEGADLVFLSTEPYPFKEKHIKELKEYFPHAQIMVVDGEMFSWYGSRLIKAFDYFKTLDL